MKIMLLINRLTGFTQGAVMRNNVNYIGYSEKQILFRAKNNIIKKLKMIIFFIKELSAILEILITL